MHISIRRLDKGLSLKIYPWRSKWVYLKIYIYIYISPFCPWCTTASVAFTRDLSPETACTTDPSPVQQHPSTRKVQIRTRNTAPANFINFIKISSNVNPSNFIAYFAGCFARNANFMMISSKFHHPNFISCLFFGFSGKLRFPNKTSDYQGLCCSDPNRRDAPTREQRIDEHRSMLQHPP